ncbi:MAG: ACP S-malonyltransferase [bacterium]
MTKKIAFLFPGQGSQHEGMGLDFVEASAAARERYRQAEEVLGESLLDLSRPERSPDLNLTLHTQPALYTLSCVIAEALRAGGIEPRATAGHSAGEFAALTAAGAWPFESGLQVIAVRARLMHKVPGAGAMAAVPGLSPGRITELCESWTQGLVRVANYNSPKQTVITGEAEAVRAFSEMLKEHGARRVIPLNVSGAFHSPLMENARKQFAEFMQDIEIHPPRLPWISNRTAEPVSEPETIREHLVGQFCSPVYWTQTMDWIAAHCEAAIEAGPGKVLKGLAKACHEEFPCFNAGTVETLKETIAQAAPAWV